MKINMLIEKTKEDIIKNIYFLDNTNGEYYFSVNNKVNKVELKILLV